MYSQGTTVTIRLFVLLVLPDDEQQEREGRDGRAALAVRGCAEWPVVLSAVEAARDRCGRDGERGGGAGAAAIFDG